MCSKSISTLRAAARGRAGAAGASRSGREMDPRPISSRSALMELDTGLRARADGRARVGAVDGWVDDGKADDEHERLEADGHAIDIREERPNRVEQ